MTTYGRIITAALAVVIVFGMTTHARVARADLLDDMLNQSESNPAAKKLEATAKAKASAASTGTAASGTAVAGIAAVPAATPLVVEAYATDPLQLQAGSRFKLSLKIKNPGADDAEDVVVQIGPSASLGWGSNSELVALGSGSAKYVGTISADGSNNDAEFDLMANPASPGGMRSVAVKTTWKSKGFEHTSSEVVGLLVNSRVDLDSSLVTTGTPVYKQAFTATFKVKNTTQTTVKDAQVAFSGDGARPSQTASTTVGDIAPGQTKTITMKYIAPLVGRAKLVATLSYADDFGDRRTAQSVGWAHVQRVAPAPADTSDSGIGHVVMAFLAAIFGLGG
jgi:hypothetical protein